MASSAPAARRKKLARLAEEYGSSVEELMIEYGLDSVVPAICLNDDCDYTAEYEPDQREGWCEECGTRSMASFLVLLGML